MLSVHKVNKLYPQSQVAALKDVSFEIPKGQFVSIMGPSGSGKSTLLNIISALDTPSSGQVRIQDHEIGKLDDDALTLFRRRKIGLVFQFFNLLPTLDALDNVLLPLLLERRATSADRERAHSLLREVGLEKRIDHKIHQLSGGEMQRVALARALMLSPALLLADEPTGNLDSSIGRGILQLLKGLCEKHDTTIVMVTHDRDAAEYGHRLLLLKDGELVGDELLHGAAQKE